MDSPLLPGMPPKTRRKPRVLMSVVDAGSGGAEWLCPKCGWKDWIFPGGEKGPALSHREPCPTCNEVPNV